MVSAGTNRFGLTRHIPESIKRDVRVRCGFGCAICSATITEYEHFYPDFAEASVHDANHIVLLCPNHHGLATKGVLAKQQIAQASEDPAAKKAGYSKFDHPWFTGIPSLKLGGGSLIEGTPIPIRVSGENLLQFDPPEKGSNIARISASLRDSTGSQFLKIVGNEWRVINGNWDFQLIGNRYIFKDAFSHAMLVMKMNAPDFITIELLRTSINGLAIHITEESMMIGSCHLTNVIGSHGAVGFDFG